jgi:hypothetical protein
MHTVGGQVAADVVQRATEDAVAYHRAGYDPLHAPGVVAADAILRPQARGGLTWVSAVRAMMATNLFLNIIPVYVIAWELKSNPALSKTGIATFFTIGAFVSTFFTLFFGAIFIALAKHVSARVLYLALVCVILFEATVHSKITTTVEFGLVLGVVYLALLLCSLIAPQGQIRGLRFNAATATTFAVILLGLGILDGYLAVSSFHDVWIKVIS